MENTTKRIDYAKARERAHANIVHALTTQTREQMTTAKHTAQRKATEKQTQRKATEKQYEPITADNIERTAVCCAFVAIRYAYAPKGKSIKNAMNEHTAYDGTSTGGNNMLRQLLNGFSNSYIARKYNYITALTKYSEECSKDAYNLFIDAENQIASTNANDTDDCIQVASMCLCDNLARHGGTQCDENAFIEGVRAVHKHLYGEANNVGTRVRTKYDEHGNPYARDEHKYIMYPHLYIDQYIGTTTDEHGESVHTFEIVDINNNIARYIRGEMENDTINEILAICTPTERRILQHIALGHTYEHIARVLNMHRNTIRNHITHIREKAREIE